NFGDHELHAWVVDRARAARDSYAAVAQECIEHALQGTQSRRRNAAKKNLAEDPAIEHRRVHRLPGTDAIEIVDPAEPPIGGHKGVLHHDVVTTGRLQARHTPGVLNRVVAARHQKDAAIGWQLLWSPLLRRRAAEIGPAAVLAATGELP